MSFPVLSLPVLLSSLTLPATLDVPGVYPTIQDAVNAAVAGDEVVIAPGTYNESFTLLGKAITVRSSGGRDVTFIDGTGLADSMARAVSGENYLTVIEGLTFTNGEGGLHQNCVAAKPVGGAVYINGSALTIRDCAFVDNGLSGNVVEGGAVYVFKGGLRVEDCLFDNNGVDSEGYGGGIGSCSNLNQTVEITGSQFVANGSAFGGGARLVGFGSATVLDCDFSGNYGSHGGGLWLSGIPDATVEGCVFFDNESSHGGGLVSHPPSAIQSTLVVEHCSFIENEASFGAGANISGDRNLTNMASQVFVTGCDFVGNHAGFGGGLLLNFAMDTGYPSPDAEAYVTDCVFEGNIVDHCCNTGIYQTPCYKDGAGNGRFWGGAADMRTQYGGLIEVANCVLYENDAGWAGGFHAATCSGGEIRILSSTIADNATSGVHVRQQVDAALQFPASVLVANTILTGNGTVPADNLIDKSKKNDPLITFEARYSLVEGGFPGAGNISADPDFLAPEVGAFCLRPGSPAIDAGDNGAVPLTLVTDIDGLARMVDDPNVPDTGVGPPPVVDMGAHEAQPGGCLLGTNYCGPAVPNSTGQSGVILATGSDVAGESLTLIGFDLPPNQFGYFLASMTQGSTFPPGSSGKLCLAGTIGRFNRPGEVGFTGASGEMSLTVDTTDMPLPPGFVQAGETWNFQAWHRDVGTSNFTDGVEILFQ